MVLTSDVVIHQSDNDDGVIQIRQDRFTRALYFASDAKQSAMDLTAPERLILSYTRAMMSSLLFTPNPESALLIGLGGGSFARFLLHYFPECRIDAIERRAEVIKLAYGYFYLPERPQLRIYHGEGGTFLKHHSATIKSYDLILVDAFEHDGVSNRIANQEFFLRCHRALNQNGTLALNVWNQDNDRVIDTLSFLSVAFKGELLYLPVKERGNLIVLAGHDIVQLVTTPAIKVLAKRLGENTGIELPALLRQIRRHNRWRRWGRKFGFS